MFTTRSAAAPVAASRPRLRRSDIAGSALLVWLGLGAAAGGLTLLAKPDGSNMGFTLDLLEGSPFADYFWPAIILFGLFGVGSFVTAILWVRRVPVAPFAAFAIGCAQMIWIVIELAIIKEVSFLHPLMFLTGAAIATSALPVVAPWLRQAVARS